MFDLRSISSTAPIVDIGFGLGIMFIAAAIANLIILPKLFSRERLSAVILLTVTIIGLVCFVVVLAVSPTMIYLAMSVYAVTFAAVGIMVSRQSIGGPQALGRMGVGAVILLGSVLLAHLLAYAPR